MMKSTPCNGEKNLAPLVSPLVTFWRANYVWPTYGPNGLAMTWPMQVLHRPFVGGLRGKPRQYLLLTCQHKNYLRWEKDLDKGCVYHSGLLLYTSRKAGFACWPQNWTKPTDPDCQDWWYIYLRSHSVVRNWQCWPHLHNRNKLWYFRRSATKLRWLQISQPVGLFDQGLVGDKLLSIHHGARFLT